MGTMVATETKKMAKVTKSFLLNAELDELIKSLSEHSGASITKIITAALLHYIFGDNPLLHPGWMRLAVLLERGDMSLPYVAVEAFKMRAAQGFEEVKSIEELAVPKGKEKGDPALAWKVRASGHNGTAQNWQEAFDKAEEPLEVLIATLTQQQFDRK